jgi:hypothetical protein
VCRFNIPVPYLALECQVYSNWGVGGGRDLSGAVYAQREREREEQVDRPNFIGYWMEAV